MAVNGGSVEEFIKNARRANRPILVWYGIVSLLAVWIFAPIVLGSLELINPD
jgi:predicted nucleic acid-binding Zn ribbon protein